jgi:hypothetical protein
MSYRLRRFGWAMCIAVLALTPLPLPVGASAATAESDNARPTIKVSDRTVTLGKRVTVFGRAPGRVQGVILQMRTAENGWQDVAHTATILNGSYSFTAPHWYGTHRLRVVAQATLLDPRSVSETRTVKVKMPYRPKGKAADWSWLPPRGARWGPCQTITYRINPAGGYARATTDIRAAFRKVAGVTGFRFKYVGSTRARVTRGRPGYHPSGTDIVVDWQTPREERGLSRGAAGVGGHWVLHGRRFDGYMILDRTERLSRRKWRQIMTHEVGHIVGLGHASSRSQLMFGVSSSRNVRFGAGDLAGLRRVGASRGCLEGSSAYSDERLPQESSRLVAH